MSGRAWGDDAPQSPRRLLPSAASGKARFACIPSMGCSNNHVRMFLLPPDHHSDPPHNDRSQNDLSFSSLYRLSLSWNLTVQKSITTTDIYNIIETIIEFIYIYSLVSYKAI